MSHTMLMIQAQQVATRRATFWIKFEDRAGSMTKNNDQQQKIDPIKAIHTQHKERSLLSRYL
jgi:hypothetical protein